MVTSNRFYSIYMLFTDRITNGNVLFTHYRASRVDDGMFVQNRKSCERKSVDAVRRLADNSFRSQKPLIVSLSSFPLSPINVRIFDTDKLFGVTFRQQSAR